MGDETSWSLRLMGRNENEGVCSDLVEQKWTSRNVVAARPLTLLGVILPSRRPEPPSPALLRLLDRHPPPRAQGGEGCYFHGRAAKLGLYIGPHG